MSAGFRDDGVSEGLGFGRCRFEVRVWGLEFDWRVVFKVQG